MLPNDRITFDPKVMGGKPCIRGMRVIAVATGGDGDQLSRITSYLDVASGTTLIQYTYLGLNTFVQSNAPQPNLTWTVKGGSGANPYTGLDQFGRTINCLWTNGSGTVDQIQYGYNRASSRVWRSCPVAASQVPPVYQDELYSYDGLQRLVDMSRGQLTSASGSSSFTPSPLAGEGRGEGGSSAETIANLSLAQQWNLDATGNWSQFVNTDVSTPANNLDQQRTASQVNEITAISQRYGAAWSQPVYDRAGNMTAIPSGNDPTVSDSAIYDAWNRMVQVTNTDSEAVVQYAYDGLYRKILRTQDDSTRHFYFTVAWQCVEERVDDGDVDRQFVCGLRYIDDEVLSDRTVTDPLDERLYRLNDANWNTVAIVGLSDATWQVLQRFRYTTYGQMTLLNPDGSAWTGDDTYQWEYTYASYRLDPVTGLLEARFRILNPPLGSWLTRDPIGYRSGWSFYQYVDSQPNGSSDPLGLQAGAGCCCCVDSVGIAPGIRSQEGQAGLWSTEFTIKIRVTLSKSPDGNSSPCFLTIMQISRSSVGRFNSDGWVTQTFYEPDKGIRTPESLSGWQEIFQPSRYSKRCCDDTKRFEIDVPISLYVGEAGANAGREVDIIFTVASASNCNCMSESKIGFIQQSINRANVPAVSAATSQFDFGNFIGNAQDNPKIPAL